MISSRYSARLVEVDAEAGQVLVHFDGWNARFDEWMPMTSDRLRPIVRTSERKHKSASKPVCLVLEHVQIFNCSECIVAWFRDFQEYKLGQWVFAKWTDCRMYQGKVEKVHNHGLLKYRISIF